MSGNMNDSTPGQLSQTSLSTDSDEGLLAFYRLILCVYFNAHRACLNKFSNPVELFDSINEPSILEHHYKALDIVRKASWVGVYEDQLLPSNGALRLHWLRTCWVATVWGNVHLPVFTYPDISLYGYNVSNDNGEIHVNITWDTDENIDKIKANVLYLTRGCSCAKNKCINRQCKCKKANNLCGPGCRCKNCQNTLRVLPSIIEENDTHTSSESDSSDSDDFDDSDIDTSSIESSDEADSNALLSHSDSELSE